MQAEIVHYAVKDLIPGFFDVAGLMPEADAMRSVDMLSETCVDEAVSLLRQVREEAAGRWGSVVAEVCFWAEAVVWASLDADARTLEECRQRLVSAISDGYALTAVH